MTSPLIFAIGDIHGRLDLLEGALHAIAGFEPGRERRTIFLGDYVDRGPEARGVVELLMSMRGDPCVVCLKGNHEQMMLDALVDGTTDEFEFWLRMGGRETLASYGAHDVESALRSVPVSHLNWMTQLPVTSGDGDRIYVHAGLKPGTPLDQQDEMACLWIRDRFLKAPPHRFERHVVHGHTPTWEGKPDPRAPELLAHRTNLDLAAYATNALGIGVFESGTPGGPITVLAVEKEPGGETKVREIHAVRPSTGRRTGPAPVLGEEDRPPRHRWILGGGRRP
ncbi:MAG: metallophosphoesterase [Nitrososphaerales archaeon]